MSQYPALSIYLLSMIILHSGVIETIYTACLSNRAKGEIAALQDLCSLSLVFNIQRIQRWYAL